MTDDDLFNIDVDSNPAPLDIIPDAAQKAAPAGDEPPATYYGAADEWVRKFLLPTYRRRVTAKGQSGGSRWAADWWSSVEAMLRLESQWRMWEEARRNPSELSTWMVGHLDVHMTILLAADGPFATSSDENRPGEMLPYSSPPVGMFPPDLQSS